MPRLARARCTLNELSFARAVGIASDEVLLQSLVRTWVSLLWKVPLHDRNRIVFEWPIDAWTLSMPSGSAFSAAMARLQKSNSTLATLLKSAITSRPFDPSRIRAKATSDGKAGHGLARALSSKGMTISLDVAGWQQSPIQVRTSRRTAAVCNAWMPTLLEGHVRAIDRHVRTLPEYENPGTHQLGHIEFDSQKSQMPTRAQSLLQNSLREDRRNVWWAYCLHGFFHRFSGSDTASVRVHWNGTTNPNAKQSTPVAEVPIKIQRRLKNRGGTPDCGCREVR